MENTQPTHEQDNRPYNPLMDSVNVKPYTRLNVDAPPDALSTPIPEASFQQNVVNSSEPAYDIVSQENNQKSGFNNNAGGNFSAMGGGGNSMKNEDAEMGAKQLAKVIIDSYEGLHALGNKGLQFSERKLRNLQKEGLIDLSIPVPLDMSGQTIPAGEFIQELNKNNENTLTVSPQFKKEVTPVLTRVLAKRGAGMTDEQMLIYLFGKDIAVKGVLFMQVKSTMNDYLEQLKEYTEAMKGTAQPQTAAAPAASPATATVVQMPQNQQNAEDFNFVQNETFQQTVVQQTVVPETGKQRAIRQRATNDKLAGAAARAQATNQSGAIKPEVQQLGQSSYQKMKEVKRTGKRGVRSKVDPKDYIEQVDESQVASLLQLRPSEAENTNESTEEPI